MHPQRWIERAKSLRVDPVDDRTLRFVATLVDHSEGPEGHEVVHSLRLEGTIGLPDLTILTIEAKALQQPYRECAASVEPVRQLAGLRIGRGFTQRVLELLGGVRGCSHFLALVLDLAGSHTLATYLQLRDRVPLSTSDDDDSDWTRVALEIEPRLENACIGLAAELRPMRNARRPRAPGTDTQG